MVQDPKWINTALCGGDDVTTGIRVRYPTKNVDNKNVRLHGG